MELGPPGAGMTENEVQMVKDWYKSRGHDEWPTFVCTYRYKDKDWGFDIVARDFDDARQRLAALGTWGKVDGVLYGTIPATPASGLYVRALVFLRNLLRR